MTEDEARAALRDVAERYVTQPDTLEEIKSLMDRVDLPSFPAKGVLALIDMAKCRPFDSVDEATIAEIVHFFL